MWATISALLVFACVFAMVIAVAEIDRGRRIRRSAVRTFDRVCEGACTECDREESEWEARGSI